MEEVREEEEEVGKEEGRGVRVLVVDDSPVDRRVVEMLLKRSGVMYEVIAVDSGQKAMKVLGLSEMMPESSIFNDLKIDIILTDYCMPEMTGYDLLKTVKDCTCLRSIPVVIMSSENEPQIISRCRATGAEDFILKPLQIKDVKRLKDYVRSAAATPKSGTKRKMPIDLMAENSGSERERRPHLAGVAVA